MKRRVTNLTTLAIFLFSSGVGESQELTPSTGAAQVISNISVQSGKAYEVMPAGLQEGVPVYIDRTCRLRNLPSNLDGLTYIKTANSDKNSAGDDFLSFSSSTAATVFVAHDDRILQKPMWMTDFSDSGMNITIAGNPHSLWQRDFGAGTIVLGGNKETSPSAPFGDGRMYVVIVESKTRPQGGTDGPGLGNLSYPSSEVFQPVGVVPANAHLGHGKVSMVNGYLMVISSSDGNGSPDDGIIEFWDVSDPRNPTLFVRHDNADTHRVREAHGFSQSNSYAHEYIAVAGIEGVLFFDVTDPAKMTLTGSVTLPGTGGTSAYTGIWWVFWQAPYVYVASTSAGLYIVDASDPTQPTIVTQLSTGELGGFNPAGAFALGNLLILTEPRGSGLLTLNISDPINPIVIDRVNNHKGYSHIFVAGKILTSGGNGDPNQLVVHDVSHDGDISFVGRAGSGLGNGGYGSYQDGFFHSGFSKKYAKFDITNLQQLGTGSSGFANRDEDFGVVLGNLVFVGDDHGVGSALIAHQTEPDTLGADVHWVHPAHCATDQATTTRVGVSMSDHVNIESVDPLTFSVQPIGGNPIPGKYSVHMGLVNFSPDAPLSPKTDYEVIVNGIRDEVGNPGASFRSVFSTSGAPVGGVVSNVVATNGKPYTAVDDGAQVGRLIYIDRSYTWQAMPAPLVGATMIRTANNDKASTGTSHLTFDLTEAATVYVAYDSRRTVRPNWLNSFTDTGMQVAIANNPHILFSQSFPTGRVTLGGNLRNVGDAPPGQGSIYSVLVVPDSSQPLLGDLIVATDEPYLAVDDGAQTGQPIYIDRNYTWGTLPPGLVGATVILTANDDKATTGTDHLSFDLARPATVYVAYDTRRARRPDWLNSFADTGLQVTIPGAPHILLSQDFPAGRVTLGGNLQNVADAPPGQGSMYSVLVVPDIVPACEINHPGVALVYSSIGFSATPAADGDRTYSWSFGDGTILNTGTNSDASHTYSSPGRYDVQLTIASSAGTVACSHVQIVHHPITANQPTASSSIATAGGKVFNVNPDQDTVTAIDARSFAKLWESAVGSAPTTLAVAPDGNVWAVSQEDAEINVLAADTGVIQQTILLSRGSHPYGIAFAPNGSSAYVTLEATGEVLQLDITGTEIGRLVVGPTPRGLAVSGDSRVFVTRFISEDTHGEIIEIDAATSLVIRRFSLAFDPGPDTEVSGRGVPNYLSALRVSPDGRMALVPSKKDNIARGLFRDGLPLTFESRVRTIVSRLDLVGNSENLGARIDLNDRDMAQNVLFSPLGDIFFVSTQGSQLVEVFDVRTGILLSSAATGHAPQGMALDPSTRRLFVHNYLSRSISVYDVSTVLDATSNTMGPLAEIPTTAAESLATAELRGKRIFYNASDPRMSQDGYISCASCHLDGGSDGRVWDVTQVGEGLRNTISLQGRSGLGHGNVHWTADFDEIQDFENIIRNEFGGTGFMTDEDFNATSDALGAPKANLSPELDDLAAFVASLSNFKHSPYRFDDGSLTPEGNLGRDLFLLQRCDTCHSGANFTDGQRHDVGTIQTSSGLGIGNSLVGVGFDTPTLRGVWATAPYLHNGAAATLFEVLDNPEHGNTTGLTETERMLLVDYLLQIE